nr:CHAT domain-containing protein [Rhodococcus sp. (in: high G+C Gram-positive bacteria)]
MRRNGLVAAVRSGVVGSSVVRARLDELLGSVDPVRAAGEFAVVMGLSAEWWFRVNDAGGSSEQALDWESGERAALDAVTLLRPAGVSLDPELEATCWLGAALSLAGRGREIEQLERLLWSVRCVAELMVTVSTTADRTRLSNGFARVFDTGAALSVELGDHDAADVIMEAARRDRVGLILAELARNPDVDTAIRSSALAVSDSSAAIPTTTTTDGEDGDEDGGTPAASSTESRSAAILIDRQGAVSDAERVLGPLGALCDASALMSITAASILDRRSDLTGTTVVLQLFPQQTSQSSGEDREVSTVRVYRRLTWIEGGDDSAVEEHLDHFDPPKTLLATSAEDRRIFAWLPTFAQILPQPLLDLLARADRSSPVRLMIVPTGLFHVPFDALPLSGSGLRDEMLIDRAVVSVHGSLTSMLALMRTDTVPSIVPSIAVYDGERADGELKHVEAEFVSLNTHVPGVIRVRGAEELRERLRRDSDSEPIAMLAMGVHGSSDDHGWGQGKTMPDGSIVTAAQALGWKAPRLCVLASCHSPITTADGVELSGFPLALMLTGAATVIGGLYDIDDKATTVIMNRFWELYAGGTAPLIALHQAKVEWLHHNPDVRRTPRLWAGLVTYGAATQ